MIDFRNLKEFNDFEGVDCNIDISLFEYGIAWKKTETIDEYTFVYGIRGNESGEYDRFDTSFYTLSDFISLLSGREWMKPDDIKSFLSFVGSESVSDLSFPNDVSYLIHYWGHENIFGNSYCGGFAIKKEEEEEEEEDA